jgi:DNA-binding transcriptional ArsR family regulator
VTPTESSVGAVFAALADPTRRAVLRAVADAGAATATDLGAVVGVTRQAAAKHLDQLSAAGLVADERSGRERRWRVTPQPMADAAAWLDTTGRAWDDRLARLASAASADRDDRPGGSASP